MKGGRGAKQPQYRNYFALFLPQNSRFNICTLSSASRVGRVEGGIRVKPRDSQGEGLRPALLSPSRRGKRKEGCQEPCPEVRGRQGRWGAPGRDTGGPQADTSPGDIGGRCRTPSAAWSAGKLPAGAGLRAAEPNPQLRQSTLQLLNMF